MKKFVSLLLCLAMVMGLAACGNSNKTASTKDTGKTQPESAANTGGTDGTEGTGGTDATAGESSGGAGAKLILRKSLIH